MASVRFVQGVGLRGLCTLGPRPTPISERESEVSGAVSLVHVSLAWGTCSLGGERARPKTDCVSRNPDCSRSLDCSRSPRASRRFKEPVCRPTRPFLLVHSKLVRRLRWKPGSGRPRCSPSDGPGENAVAASRRPRKSWQALTLSGGSLGSCVDEERSQLRELM